MAERPDRDESEWDEFEPSPRMFVADPTDLAPTAIRSRRARFVIWMAILGTLGLSLASVVVR